MEYIGTWLLAPCAAGMKPETTPICKTFSSASRANTFSSRWKCQLYARTNQQLAEHVNNIIENPVLD